MEACMCDVKKRGRRGRREGQAEVISRAHDAK